MPRKRYPRRGSLQFWPRKRAKSIIPRTSEWPKSKDVKPLGFAAWKAGMTHVLYNDNNAQSPTYGKVVSKTVTILDSAPLMVVSIRYYHNKKCVGEQWMEKMPKGVEKKVGKRKGKEVKDFNDVMLVVATQPDKSGMRKNKSDVFEIGLGGKDAKEKEAYGKSMLGKEIKAEDVFKPGEFVDISGVTKGHGFTGSVKRFGIKIQGRKDQQHHRHTGSIGGVVPRKVDWRVPLPGQYGLFTRTEINKRVILIDNDAKKVMPKGGFLGYGVPKNVLVIEGSIPGHRKRLIRLRKATVAKAAIPVEIKHISTDSKQG